MKYQNKKNLRYATLIEENTKFNTVTMQYEDDGSNTSITTSTLKRWWKKVEEESPVKENNVEEIQEEVAGDGTPLAEVGKEIAAQAKEKAKKSTQVKEKKTRRLKEPEAYAIEAMEFVFNTVEKKFHDKIFVPAKDIKMRTFKTGGHMYCKFNYSNSSITVAVRGKSLPDKFTIPDKTVNHMFDSVYQFKSALTDKDKKLITDILSNARDYRISKNNKNKKKEEK